MAHRIVVDDDLCVGHGKCYLVTLTSWDLAMASGTPNTSANRSASKTRLFSRASTVRSTAVPGLQCRWSRPGIEPARSSRGVIAIEYLNHHDTPLGIDGSPWAYWEWLRNWGLDTGTDIGWSKAHGGHGAVLGYEAGKEIFQNHVAVSSRHALWPHYQTPGGRRRSPRNDLISVLLASEVDGRPLTDLEVYDSWVMQLIGGIDNTKFSLAPAMWRLAWDRELRRRLVADPSLIPLALDEFLRYYSPACTAREVAQDVEVAGVQLTAAQSLLLVIPVMNRDPRQFANPDVFIPDRSPNRHMTLGLGVHRCPGAHLVKIETCVAIGEMLHRIPASSIRRPPRRGSKGRLPGLTPCRSSFPRAVAISGSNVAAGRTFDRQQPHRDQGNPDGDTPCKVRTTRSP